jgi:conjugative relaxase-like TrwC/TraI family protein
MQRDERARMQAPEPAKPSSAQPAKVGTRKAEQTRSRETEEPGSPEHGAPERRARGQAQTLAPCGAGSWGRRPGGLLPRRSWAMLSRGKVTALSVSYYTDTVAVGLEDYYTGRGEAPGRWVGRGSAAAGLRGEVCADELARLFDARHPVSGESLGEPYRVRDGADRVTGWDLTFSAPKSVSTLWATAGGEVGMAAREGHDAAVAAGLVYLEDHAAFSRQGKSGVRQVDTEGVLAAAFVHRTSRAGDPQLHTHVLVSGRVRCLDGVWRALDSRALHWELKTGGMVYQAALRAELTARLGVEWTSVDHHGQAELVDVPTGLRDRFSQRAAAVEARAAELIAEAEATLGRELTPKGRRRIYEVAVLETRTAKHSGAESDEGLFDRWRGEAVAAGWDPDRWIEGVVHRRALPAPDRPMAVREVLEDLSRSLSTWSRRDAVRAAARLAPTGVRDAGATRQWIEATAEEVLAHPAVVRLAAPEPAPPRDLRRRDGLSVFEHHGAARFTTLETLGIEQRVLDLAVRAADRRGVALPAAVDAAITEAGLGADQASAVRAVTQDGDTVICVVGSAGTGKSRTMGAAARAWQVSGVPVRGLAVSAVAAGVLQTEAGIPSETVAKLLFEHDRPGGPDTQWRLHRGEVVVVDEAAMVASRDLARLTQLAAEAQAKLVLVGDHAQLGAVEAGGLFRLLADTGAVELSGVRRFSHDWERHASLRLRARDPAVIATYDQHGRIRGCDRLEALDAAYTAWVDARAVGQSVVVCASDHATVDATSCRIRAHRVAAGQVEPGGVHAGGHVVGVGDEIVTTRNDRRLMTSASAWVRNGDRWTITHRHPDGSLTVSHLGGHGRVVLPADYVNQDVALAYALTVHKAQGVTVDRAVLVADEATTAEALYVGVTRGRHHNTALVVCDNLDPDHHDPAPTATEVLTAALHRVSAEQAALDVLRQTLAASESLAVLAPRLGSLNAWIHRQTPPDPSAELQRLTARRAHLERHAHPGVLTRASRDDRRLFRQLDQRQQELEQAGTQRDDWLEQHADTFAYRDDLARPADAKRLAYKPWLTSQTTWSTSSARSPTTTPAEPDGPELPAASRPTASTGASSPRTYASLPSTASSIATGRHR